MRMTHPDSKQAITVADDAAEIYRSQGWCEVAEPADDAPKPRAKK